MDKNRFLEYIDIYGADITAWPEGVRESAAAAVESSPELAFILEDEFRFEALLSGSAIEKPSPGLEARIIAAAGPKRKAPERGTGFLAGIFSGFPLFVPRFALPLLLVVGIAAGYVLANYSESGSDEPVQLAGVLYYEEGIYE